MAADADVLGAPVGWALVVSSALFALGHVAVIPNPQRLAVFFPALLFGWMRARTGSIAAGASFHALCNVVSDVCTPATSAELPLGRLARSSRLDVAEAKVVEEAGDQLLLGGGQVALRLLLEHREDVDGVLGERQVLLGRRVGVLELAEVQEGRAAQRQDEGVEVDGGQRRAPLARRRRRPAPGGVVAGCVGGCSAVRGAALGKERRSVTVNPPFRLESPMAGRLRTPRPGFNHPGRGGRPTCRNASSCSRACRRASGSSRRSLSVGSSVAVPSSVVGPAP